MMAASFVRARNQARKKEGTAMGRVTRGSKVNVALAVLASIDL
jgi:hypothetical protein